jgi:glycerate 2-kinase
MPVTPATTADDKEHPTVRILIAPSGFKESLDAAQAAGTIEAGIRRALPHAIVQRLPLVDGGEGFTDGVVAAAGGHVEPVVVTGPVGRPVTAHLGWLPGLTGATAVLDMASAGGLRLVPRDHRRPGATTTRGVGELVRTALDRGARRIVVGCGDSGTNDGGAGLAAALGARFLDAEGVELPDGGDHLAHLDRVDPTGLDPRLARCDIEVACNITNLLCGPRGVARAFGPQKGATADDVERLSAALDRYAAVVERDLGEQVADLPGGGASGGLGAGLVAFCGAVLRPRMEVVSRWLDLDTAIVAADLVVTAEGSLDHQTPYGKVPAEVARRAHYHGVPVIALAGTLGPGARRTLEDHTGIDAFSGILRAPCTLPEAIDRAAEWLADAAEQAVRLLLVGASIATAQALTG